MADAADEQMPGPAPRPAVRTVVPVPPSPRRAGVWGEAPAGAGGARLKRTRRPCRLLFVVVGVVFVVQFTGVVGGFVFGRRQVSDRAEQPGVVEPADPFGGGRLHLADITPWPEVVDDLGLVQPDHRLGEGVIV